MIRLQKALAERGVASRRASEELMRAGRVRVDGIVVREMGSRVAPGARIDVDGRSVGAPARHRYVVLNKPRGIVTTARDEHGRDTVVDLLAAPERLYPVGRLDEDSEGLVLMTNDGAWAERVLHPRHGHEREYEVLVAGQVTAAALAASDGPGHRLEAPGTSHVRRCRTPRPTPAADPRGTARARPPPSWRVAGADPS